MTTPRVTLIGADTFDRTMNQAADSLEDMKTATDKTAGLVMSEARRRAPRRTGRLGSSILMGTEQNAAVIGSDLVYALPIHWGWRARNIPPSLFLIEAAADTEAAWTDLFRDDVVKAMGKVKGR